MIPTGFSNLTNLVSLSLSKIAFQGFFIQLSLCHFTGYLLNLFKIEEDFPSCFQNMTRLTNLELVQVRRSNSEPIPFPTQFCNMIYLQTFTSINNNFSGLF